MKTNWPLKIKIKEKFGTQADGAFALGVNESTLSRVVRRRRELSENDKKRWATVLDSTVQELFPED